MAAMQYGPMHMQQGMQGLQGMQGMAFEVAWGSAVAAAATADCCCLHACLPSCLPACLRACLPTCLPDCLCTPYPLNQTINQSTNQSINQSIKQTNINKEAKKRSKACRACLGCLGCRAMRILVALRISACTHACARSLLLHSGCSWTISARALLLVRSLLVCALSLLVQFYCVCTCRVTLCTKRRNLLK